MDKELLKRFFEGQATTDEEMRVREWMDCLLYTSDAADD